MKSLARVAAGLAAMAVVVACGAGPRQALAQQDTTRAGDVRVGIRYSPGYLPRLALPPVTAGTGLEEVAARVDSILRRDLAFSDRFQMMPVPDSIPTDGPVNYGLWDQLEAVWLLVADVSGGTEEPLLRLSLHDVVYGSVEDVEAFPLTRTGAGGFRMAVHRASDAVVRWATGDPGIAATRIAFRRKLGGGRSAVYVVDSDGENLRRVVSDTSMAAYSPAFSPDTRRLMYVARADAKHTLVREVDLRTGDARTIAERNALTPAYAPDGSTAMVGQWAGSSTEIFELGLDPVCCRRRVTRSGAGDALNPAYSPDGGRIAFTATSLGTPQVYVQEVNGGSPELVSEFRFGENSYATSPDWSPRRDLIAYHSRQGGVFQIMTVAPDGYGRRQLTSRGSNEDPSWAPDGRHLVFASDREGYRALWILDTVTGRIRALTVNRMDQMPEWSGPVPRR